MSPERRAEGGAAVALFRFRVGVIPGVAGSGLAGLAWSLLH